MLWSLLLLLLIMIGFSQYNRLIGLKNQLSNAFAQIDVQLQRRHDLIPNLVESCQGYMDHERETLKSITTARTQGADASLQVQKDPANAQAVAVWNDCVQHESLGFRRILATVEQYPDLKAIDAVQQLMDTLQSTENRIGFARQAYNDMVALYNTALQGFPGLLVARLGGLRDVPQLELSDPTIREVPHVHLSCGNST